VQALVVDDDPQVLRLVEAILSGAAVACILATSADEAIGALAQFALQLSVVITDVQMPGPVDGLGLIRHIAGAYPWLPVIAVSGSAATLAEAGSLPSVVGTLAKPFAPRDLVRLALEAASGRSQHQND
jgi:two-component system cell cycle sensor histidine kinase/response regulator CckA